MGGHRHGEVASREAVNLIHTYLQEHKNGYSQHKGLKPALAALKKVVIDAVHYAGTTLYSINNELGYAKHKGMGTTIVGAWILPQFNAAIIFHVGDSRAYLHRGALISRLTKDHSLYQRWLDQGEKGSRPSRSIILQALGLSESLSVATHLISLEVGGPNSFVF